MYNQVTDQYRLVQIEIVKALPVFGRRITAMNGYSLEIFRGQVHLGSVRTHVSEPVSNTGRESVKMRVNNGDVIYKINTMALPVPVIGSLMTKDKYVRIYDITVDLVVSNPILFVDGYRLGRDPVKLAIEKIKTSLQDYGSQTEYDKLVRFKQPQDVWNNKLLMDTGIRVSQINWWALREDPQRDDAATIQREAENKKKSITTQGEIQKLEDKLERERDALKREYERREQRKQNEFEHEEEMLQHMHDLHYRLRETAAQELTDILRERIRETFEGGRSISEVAKDSLKLLDAFHESLHRGSVVDATLSNGSNTNTNGTSSETHSISSDEDSTGEHEVTTDPLYTPPIISDLSDAEKKKAKEE